MYSDPKCFTGGGGGGGGAGGCPNFRQERTIEFFCGKLISTSNNPWQGKYCFANRGERLIGGYPKTITFLNIPGIKSSEKMQRAFH